MYKNKLVKKNISLFTKCSSFNVFRRTDYNYKLIHFLNVVQKQLKNFHDHQLFPSSTSACFIEVNLIACIFSEIIAWFSNRWFNSSNRRKLFCISFQLLKWQTVRLNFSSDFFSNFKRWTPEKQLVFYVSFKLIGRN